MSFGASGIHSHSSKIGTCPHGMPLGACPICNGAAGGNSTTKRDTPRNVGEMTYNQCAAIGAMLRAQKHAKEQAKIAEQSRLDSLAEFQKNISNTHRRLVEYSAMISNTMPSVIAKPVTFVLNIVANVLNIVQNIPQTIGNLVQVVSQKVADISDKLTAVYGELKAAVDKKLSDIMNGIKKKLKSMFFIFGSQESDDEEKKIEEAKRTFELKTYIQKLFNRNKNEQEKDIENNEH